MTDGEIIQSIRHGGSGQEQSLHLLFSRHQVWVKVAISKHKLSEDEALDAFSDAILALRKQVLLDKFRGESKLSTYLHSIFSRRCIDCIRKKSTNKVIASEYLPDMPDSVPGVEQTIITGERFTHLLHYIEQLGEPCKQILMDRYFWGYEDMAEIAKRAGVKNANTAGSLRYRCMEKLMKLLNGKKI